MKKLCFMALAACLFAAVSAAGCSDGVKYTFENTDAYTAGEGSVSAETVVSLDIDWVAGGVEIAVSESATEISFSESSEYTEEEYKLRYLVDDSVLRIRFMRSGAKIKSGYHKELRVTVPNAFSFESVKIGNVSGDVSFMDIRAESMHLKTVSGDITACYLNVGDLHAESVSGDIVAGQGNFGNVFLKTTSGKITFENSDKSLRQLSMETVSGAVRFWAETVPEGGLSAKTTSGNVELILTESAGFRLTYQTQTGSFNDGFGTRPDGQDYVAGNGEGSVTVSTVSGGLTLRRVLN